MGSRRCCGPILRTDTCVTGTGMVSSASSPRSGAFVPHSTEFHRFPLANLRVMDPDWYFHLETIGQLGVPPCPRPRDRLT